MESDIKLFTTALHSLRVTRFYLKQNMMSSYLNNPLKGSEVSGAEPSE